MTRQLILVKHSLPSVDPGLPANQEQRSPTSQPRGTTLAQRLFALSPYSIENLVLDLPVELDQYGDVGNPIDIFNPCHPGTPV